MNIVEVARALGALGFVLALIILGGWLLRRYGNSLMSTPHNPSNKRRIEVLEITVLDHRRKLALIRRDDKAHLLVLSPTSELLIESGIELEHIVLEKS